MFELLNQKFDFSGCKIALVCNGQILTILRDDLPSIPYPNTWDLPGGGREGNETPFECVAREVYEELGLSLKSENIIWLKTYPGVVNPKQQSVFMISKISQEEIETIIFGDEGQGYKLMPIEAFLSDKTIIPQLRKRLSDYYY